MARHNTQNGQTCCDSHPPFGSQRVPRSMIISQIARRRMSIPLALRGGGEGRQEDMSPERHNGDKGRQQRQGRLGPTNFSLRAHQSMTRLCEFNGRRTAQRWSSSPSVGLGGTPTLGYKQSTQQYGPARPATALDPPPYHCACAADIYASIDFEFRAVGRVADAFKDLDPEANSCLKRSSPSVSANRKFHGVQVAGRWRHGGMHTRHELMQNMLQRAPQQPPKRGGTGAQQPALTYATRFAAQKEAENSLQCFGGASSGLAGGA